LSAPCQGQVLHQSTLVHLLPLGDLLLDLRDDRQLLHDPDGMFTQPGATTLAKPQSLYPQGFSAARLIEVVETQAVWDGI